MNRPTIPTAPWKWLPTSLMVVILFDASARAQSTGSAEPAGASFAPPASTSTAPSPAFVATPPGASPRRQKTQEETPAPAEIPSAAAAGEPAKFARTPLKATFGQGANTWGVTLFGTFQSDFLADTTRSYEESVGPALVARTDTYEGKVGRTQFTTRNTRVGLVLDAPTFGAFTPSAAILTDFAGNQPGVPYPSRNGASDGNQLGEIQYYNSPTLRIRYAYFTLRSRLVDIVAGETVDVFGWQSYYSLLSLSWVPNQITSRNTQFRLSRSFGVGPISVDVAVEAARPAQRDAQIPDVAAALRLSVNGWKGITTPGNAVTLASPLSISVSGISRQFKVNAFTPPPAQNSNKAMGWGLSLDLFLPIIPATSVDDRTNKLTLIGSFVTGTGMADVMVTGGGARFPTLPNPAQASPPPEYIPDVDNGLVSFDTVGVLHTIDWWTAKGGLQYYAPGRFILAVNATYAHSKNIGKLFPRGGAEIDLLGTVADTTMYGEGTLLWDATPSVRFGISGQYMRVRYLDGNEPHNIRGIGQALYVF